MQPCEVATVAHPFLQVRELKTQDRKVEPRQYTALTEGEMQTEVKLSADSECHPRHQLLLNYLVHWEALERCLHQVNISLTYFWQFHEMESTDKRKAGRH